MSTRKVKTNASESVLAIGSSVLAAYKAFDRDLKCRGFQYEVGKTYTHEGDIELCAQGFHACMSPLNIFSYYPFLGSRFALVELSGNILHETENPIDGKSVAQTIKIVRELTLADIITAQHVFAVKYANDKNTSYGDYSKAASSGDSSTAASSGNSSTAASSGNSSTATSSGDSSKAASSGNYSKAASSGDSSTAASSGDSSTAASSGNSSTAASSGNSSTATSSGDSSKAASSGNSSTAASSGNSSTATSSGDSSTAASSGDSSTAASSGNYSKAASSGDISKAACDTNGFACVAGIGGDVRGREGSALSLGYLDSSDRNRIAVAYVGENGIEPDTWYFVNRNGEFEKRKAKG